jgi:hypothetical protein
VGGFLAADNVDVEVVTVDAVAEKRVDLMIGGPGQRSRSCKRR